jgi:hypothetical protein
VDVLTSSSIDVSEIGRIDITLDGQVVETITRDQLVNGPLGLQFTGTLIRLDVTPSAQNLVNAAVYFTDGVKSGEVDLLIASALNNTSVVSNGTTSNVTFGAFSTFFDADAIGASNVNLLANNLGNNIVATNTGGSFSLFGGDDFILSSQTAGSTIDRVIDGGDGFDVVQYVENFIQNAASKIGNVLKIGSNSDTLSNVEEVRFADAILDVESFSVRFLTTGTDDSD